MDAAAPVRPTIESPEERYTQDLCRSLVTASAAGQRLPADKARIARAYLGNSLALFNRRFRRALKFTGRGLQVPARRGG